MKLKKCLDKIQTNEIKETLFKEERGIRRLNQKKNMERKDII